MMTELPLLVFVTVETKDQDREWFDLQHVKDLALRVCTKTLKVDISESGHCGKARVRTSPRLFPGAH